MRHLEIHPKPVKFQEISLKLMKFHVFHRGEFGVYEWCFRLDGMSACHEPRIPIQEIKVPNLLRVE